jgi:hypothetical protein
VGKPAGRYNVEVIDIDGKILKETFMEQNVLD